MSNRFCIFLSEDNNLLTLKTQPQDKIYPLKQGRLLIIDDTPYDVYYHNNENWHIIGHIDNLHLLNYLLFSYYPSAHEFISKEIICLAVKRYGMRIIELLSGNFCIVYEDVEGNLTLITEAAPPNKLSPPAGIAAKHAGRRPAACAILTADSAQAGARTGARAGMDSTPPVYLTAQGAGIGKASACRQSAASYARPSSSHRISVSSWHENQLRIIQSFRSPVYSSPYEGDKGQIESNVRDIKNHSIL